MRSTTSIIIYFLIFVTLGIRLVSYLGSGEKFNDGDVIRISATIRSEPIRYESSQYIKIHGLKIYLPLYPRISYGDKVMIKGVVANDRLSQPELELHQNSESLIYMLRKRLLGFYTLALPGSHAGLVAGVTIGSKEGISQDFWETLKNSGTAHVVVASGMNVTLVGGFLINTLTVFFKRKKALIASLFGIWIYAVLAGFDAPIVRASIMGSIAFTAQELGRLNVSIRALLISMILMLLFNPSYIVDLGFYLSSFATLGVLLFTRLIKNKLTVVPSILKEDLSTSLAAQIGVVPILFYFFGQFNILSPLINALVLWTVVPMTLIGMVGGVMGLASEPIGTAVLWLTYPLTLWFMKIVEIFG